MGRQTWQRPILLLLTGLFGLLLLGESLVSSTRWIGQPFPGFFVHENLTVGPYFLPGWSGSLAGIESLDRVLSVNGVTLHDRGQLYGLVRRQPLGAVLDYRVWRNGRSLDLKIATMTFDLRDWALSFGIYIVIGIAFLVIGVAPYLFRAASPVALPLCFMVLTVFIWFQTTFDYMTDALLPKELRIFALTLTPSAAIHLALMLSKGDSLPSLSPLYVLALYGVGLVLGVFNSLTFFGPPETWIDNFRAGYVFVCVGAVSFIAITGYALQRSQRDLDRSRLRVMFVGSLIGFLIPALAAVLTSFYRLAIPYNLILAPTVCFPLSVAYALLKYSLFDLGNALRVGLSRLALMGLLVGIYAVVALSMAPWVGRYAKEPLIPILFSILVVAIFNPLLRRLERIVDRYVYKQDYDAAEVQQEISLFLRSLDDAVNLARGFVSRIAAPLHLTNALVVYRSKLPGELVVAMTPSTGLIADLVAADGDLLIERLGSDDYGGITRSEVINHPRFAANREVLLSFFDRWRSALLMPLVYERKICGVASFGAKQQGGEYSIEDFRLLRTLSEQLALSLENGRLYAQSVQAYKRVEAVNKKLIESDRIKKDFVANICHELRTPVSTIIGFGEILREQTFQDGARTVLDRLVNNGQELCELMDNLMNYSRMEADRPSTQFEIVKLTEILNGLQMMTRRLIRSRPIEFDMHLESGIDVIESDGQKLQQILVHLITNALKFTEKGRIELSIGRHREESEEYLTIAVADTGIGIELADQELIFEDFRQLDGSSTRHYGGTGLGLGLCRKLAAALGGDIQVSSEVGVGSIFRLRIPMRVPDFVLREPVLAGQALMVQ
jgi:signal transduction histidine kinase